MADHRYSVGETVQFLPGPLDANVTRGAYIVVRLMPSESKDLQYRVKHSQDGYERVVRESQLAPLRSSPL